MRIRVVLTIFEEALLFTLWLDSNLLRFCQFISRTRHGVTMPPQSRWPEMKESLDVDSVCHFSQTDLRANKQIILFQDLLLGQVSITVHIRLKHQVLRDFME